MKLLPFIMVILAVVSYFASRGKKNTGGSASKTVDSAPKIENATDAQNALRHSDWHMREAAVRALAQSSDPKALTDLAAALNDDDDDVREAARQVLEGFGAAAVPALLDALHSSRFEARGLAAKALGTIHDPSAVPGLIEALSDKSVWVRLPAAEALGIIGNAQAVSGLMAALRDEEMEVQKAATAALKRIDTPEARKALKLHTHT